MSTGWWPRPPRPCARPTRAPRGQWPARPDGAREPRPAPQGRGAGGTMTNALGGLELPRPAAPADEGPLDARLYDLVEARVRRLLTDNPIFATVLGVHSEDGRLGDASRDAV